MPRFLSFAVLIVLSACSSDSPMPAPSQTPPPAPASRPKALEGATIIITPAGLMLDASSAAAFGLDDLHVYQGTRLTFINNDNDPHDMLSGPFGLHNECPEINAAGYLVPGQSRSTDPLNRLASCGFHDHNREGNPAFGGRVITETR
jgi:hypothetical protein